MEGPALTSHHIPLTAQPGQEKAKQPEGETSFRHNQVKNAYFSDQSSVPKWSENPGKMRQARLVAGFQHQHLPSEESSKESQLIHPGHTSISSSYYWLGCWGLFFPLFRFFRPLSRFGICWEGTTATGTELGCPGGWRDPQECCIAPGTSPGTAGRSGWKRRDQCKGWEQGAHTGHSP